MGIPGIASTVTDVNGGREYDREKPRMAEGFSVPCRHEPQIFGCVRYNAVTRPRTRHPLSEPCPMHPRYSPPAVSKLASTFFVAMIAAAVVSLFGTVFHVAAEPSAATATSATDVIAGVRRAAEAYAAAFNAGDEKGAR